MRILSKAVARALGVATGLTCAGLAASAAETYFRTPSANIHCAFMDYDAAPSLRCDIQNFTPGSALRPSDCDLDWGFAYSITASGKLGTMLCAGDTVMTPDAEPLPYGAVFEQGGITCLSETSGLTCSNAAGHGFFLSKAKQRVF